MVRLGIYATPAQVRRMQAAQSTSGMALSGGEPMGNPARVAHAAALEQGLLDFEGFYGCDLATGEFVAPNDAPNVDGDRLADGARTPTREQLERVEDSTGHRLYRESTVRSLLLTAGHNPAAIDGLLGNAEGLEYQHPRPVGVDDELGVFAEAAYVALDRAGAHLRALPAVVAPEAPEDDVIPGAIAHVGGFVFELGRALVYSLTGVAIGMPTASTDR